jgi:hypothetical protein
MKISIEGHYEGQRTPRGNDRVWVPDQLIVECRCGKELRAGGYSTLCQRGADHTALVREAERELAENYSIRFQYQDYEDKRSLAEYYSIRFKYQDYEDERSTRVVYKASDIVKALTKEKIQKQIAGATDRSLSVLDQALSEPATPRDGISPAYCIEDAIVAGDLNLKHCTVEVPLEVRNCWFMGAVDLRYCEFRQAVHFLECTFHQEFNSGDDKESHTNYRKELNCNGSRFEKAAMFNGIHVEGTAYFHESSFNLEGTNDHAVNFTAASFDRNLECIDSVFKGSVSFNSLRCDGNGSIKRARFGRGADFTAASFGRNLECIDTVFKGQVRFNSIKCGGSGFFKNTMFESQKELDIRFADFGINLMCDGAVFWGPVDFHAIRCGHHGQFEHAQFKSRERVDLTNADFGGNLRCDNATFAGKVNARGLKCNVVGCFNGATFECNEVDFRSTHFGGDLDLRNATFFGRVRLGQSHLMQKLRLRGACFKGRVELYNATIRIIEILDDREWRSILAELKGRDNYEVHKPALQDDSLELAEKVIFPFKEAKSLDLSDISFERFHGGPDKELARNLALRFVEEQDPMRFSRDPYLQCESYYKHIGDEVEAKKMHYKGHCAFRDSATNRESPAGWTGKQSAWDLFLSVSTGYGLQAWRLLVPLALILMVGTFVFASGGTLLEKSDLTTVVSPNFSLWHGFAYSFDLVIPVLTFPPADQWAPNGLWREIFAVFLVIVGWLLVPLMIAAWSGIVRSD